MPSISCGLTPKSSSFVAGGGGQVADAVALRAPGSSSWAVLYSSGL